MHKVLLTTKRNDILDCCYYGSVFLANKREIYKSFGCNCDSITFMRSLAKPLQASIMADCGIVRDFKLSKKEIAIFCASHSGSPSHVKLLERLVKRFNIKKSDIFIHRIEKLHIFAILKEKRPWKSRLKLLMFTYPWIVS